MGENTARVRFVVLSTLLFFVVSLSTSPSSPSAPAEMEPPDPQEVALLAELVEWLSGAPVGNGDFHLMAQEELAAAIREKPQSFELFRRFNGTEANRKLLQHVPYGDAIYRAAQRHRVDSLLLAAVVEVESQFRPQVVSPRGAVGLTQVLPTTAELFSASNLTDPETNLDVGARYLRNLLDRFDGDLELALAAYNAGPGNVSRYGGVPPFRETRSYVRKVLGLYVSHHRDVWQATETGEELLTLGGVS